MNKNVERGQVTRAQLIDVATRLFAAHGYDGTSIEAVLAESGVSRGSLYHHFAGKEALFLAVMEAIGLRAAQPVLEAMNDALDPVAALRLGCLGWIRLAVDPVVQQIMLIDAPAVLGWGAGGSSTSRPPWASSGPPWPTPPTPAASSSTTWTPSRTSCWPPPTRCP